MKQTLLVGAVVILGVAVCLTVSAGRAAGQGPSGAGASSVVRDTTHSMNPMTWLKKDSSDPHDGPALRSEFETKLTPGLQAQGLLGANATTTEACSTFTALYDCLAALHASHNLGVDFNCLRAAMTGVHTSADVSGCKVSDEGKTKVLTSAIRELKPDANAKQATKDAEQQAMNDLKGIGG